MSLDKVESSNPNLKAVHAGASTRKTRHLQPKARMLQMPKEGCFAFSRLASHIRVLQVGGKARFAPFLCWREAMEAAEAQEGGPQPIETLPNASNMAPSNVGAESGAPGARDEEESDDADRKLGRPCEVEVEEEEEEEEQYKPMEAGEEEVAQDMLEKLNLVGVEHSPLSVPCTA